MDVPDDLSGMDKPVPHYTDIRRDTRTLPSPLGGILVTATVVGVVTWVFWGIDVLAGWLG
jgi:hypothetical protein